MGTPHEKLGLKRIPCASQFTISDTAGMRLDPVCNYINTMFSQSDHTGFTPDHSYPLVSSTSFSSSSPISLFLIHTSNIITEHNGNLSISITPCHDHELTPSSVYTEYSVPQVQYTLSAAYTEYPRLFVFPSFS